MEPSATSGVLEEASSVMELLSRSGVTHKNLGSQASVSFVERTFLKSNVYSALETNGIQAIRTFDPCEDETCDLFDDSGRIMRTTSSRWYPGVVRLEDGSLMIVG